jgi:hypothetical protein
MKQNQLSKKLRGGSLYMTVVVSIITYASITLTNIFSCYAESYHHYSEKTSRRRSFLRYQEESTVIPKISRRASNKCSLDQNGFYGTVDTSSDIYQVQYLYQVSVVVGTTTTQLNNEIIQQLDDAITTAVLPQFFVCSGRRRILQESTVTAISSMPVDTYIFSGCKCVENSIAIANVIETSRLQTH